MSDKKISQLSAASTPLAGTEVIPIVQGGVTKKATVQDIADLVPNELPTQVPGDAGKFLQANGIGGVSYQEVSRLSDIDIRNMTISNGGILINEVANGAITDGVLPKTLGGAMTTATISKVGNFDKLAVTGGDDTSFVRFDNIFSSDAECRIVLSVKVENLNKDGVTGTSNLGIVGYGVKYPLDFGANNNWGASIELISRVVTCYGHSPSSGPATSTVSSAGTLVASGDILDIEMQVDNGVPRRLFKVMNRTTGEYVYASRSVNINGNAGWIRNYNGIIAQLGIVASNADYTILDFKVYSKTTNPLIAIIGDPYTTGYNINFNQTLAYKLPKAIPYQVALYGSTGTDMVGIFTVQIQEGLKLNPRYVMFFNSTPPFTGNFIVTDPDYPVWYAAFTNVINQIIAKQAIPVLVKWPSGGITGANNPAWNTFVDQQVLLFPQIKVIDLTIYTFVWNGDSFGNPGSTDYDKMVEAINNFLIVEGY